MFELIPTPHIEPILEHKLCIIPESIFFENNSTNANSLNMLVYEITHRKI